MPRLPLLAAGLLLAGSVSVARAQDPRLAARPNPGVRAAVQHLADSASSRDLPTEPLIRKALEGESKGADSARIVSAVRSLFTLLESARQLLGPGANEGELVAGAAALRAGANAAQLSRLAALRPRDQLAVPLSVLADLLASGVPGEQAWNGVYQMASRGAHDADFLALRDRLAGSGTRPAPGMPPPVEQPPTAPLPGTERPR